MSRRSWYTRAGDVDIIDAATREPIGHQRRYSPSELNAVKSNKKPRKVRQIIEAKMPEILAEHRRAVDAYLSKINADN